MSLRSGVTYNQNIDPKKFINAESIANLSEQADIEKINANNDRISPELIEEKIKANLEHANEQISTNYYSFT